MLNKSTLESFAAPCPKQGKLELVHYTSRAYALEAIFGESPITMEKSMWVYTPYGYDPSKKYNVLFLMHGGTDNEGYWFGQGRYRGDDVQKYTDYGNITASMIDHLIYKKQIDPLIVVTPSFEEEVEPYTKLGNRVDSYFASTRYFWLELRNEIMPYLQKHYSTYAESDNEESYRNARKHFAYAGASQGSITGLYSIMCHCHDRFAFIGCFSAGAIRCAFNGKELSVALDEEKLAELCSAIEQEPPVFWYNVECVAANVFDLLPQLEQQPKRYDFIILDPPAFTKSRKTTQRAMTGYKEINYRAMRLLPRGGYLATCSCSHFATEELFLKMLRSAAKDAGVQLRQIEARQQCCDHPILWGVEETNYLKFYLFQVV